MKNKKLVKGILAGIIGLALLLGGGTFALWYQTSSVAAGTVQSGQLNFTVGTPTWTVVGADTTGTTPSTAAGSSIASIAAFKMVPGDTVTYSTTLTVNAVGDTLKAKLSVNLGNITASGTGTDLATAIKSSSKTTVTVGSGSGKQTASAASTVTFSVTPSAAAFSVPVTITLHFPAATDGDTPNASRTNWWGQTAQSQAIDLSKLTIDLAQSLT